MNKTVVSFADGRGNYLKQLARLELSLKSVGYDGNFKGINDYGHIRSKLHSEVPYQFKPKSIQKAREEFGGVILWCDSPVYAKSNIDHAFAYIKEHGVMLFDNIGFTIGDYTSDACLSQHGMTREESFQIPMVMAACMGFDFDNPKAVELFDKYNLASDDGVSYMGSWSNANCEVSNDMRVQGTRHDQSVISILAHQMNIPLIKGNETFFMYQEWLKIMPKSDSVCLFSQGI
jgi:hypothetical protein